MIHFNSGRPTQVALRATVDDAKTLDRLTPLKDGTLGSFTVDPYQNTVTYKLPESLASEKLEVRIHGYVPRGWTTDVLLTLPPGESAGVWHYPEEQEKNILAGLSYLSIGAKGADDKPLRAQIEPIDPPKARFEDFVTVTALAGSCQTKLTIFGLLENVPLEMEPAQVIMARTEARKADAGGREQEIGCAIRVGGAYVPGIGKIEIGMFGSNNPGHIASMSAESDFPARMTLDVRKHYMTPSGTFYSDREEFEAEDIMSFPPFGVKFLPTNERVPLREEKSGNIVGELTLGWLVPLCYLDASNFPPRAIPPLEPEGEGY